MNTDRNLLFGMISMQAGLIDAGQFVEIVASWATRKHTALAQLLIERGWIDEADRSHVEYLLERQLTKHDGDAPSSLSSIPKTVRLSLLKIEDPAIQQSLSWGSLTDPCVDEAGEVVFESRVTPDSFERYELLELHAAGGMGRVWQAWDKTLDRTVALKQLKPELARDAVLRARFHREATITGQMEHPGIVPVYDLVVRPGVDESFYTMRLVNGRTLAEAASAFHEARLKGKTDSTGFVQLLNAFVAVCKTVAYAHSKGVIHRDLKGQNVVLGDFGETAVLDWGFAKQPAGSGLGESNVNPNVDEDGASDAELTRHGETVGTPSYMSPEQAAGRHESIDERTDVYGLGAILYHVLTGQPPFHDSDLKEVLRKVRSEPPQSPRLLWDKVPETLEAACLRALSKEASERFASASELAAEVDRWQEVRRKRAEWALRDSESLYRSLVDVLPLILVRKDLDSRFTYANKRFCEAVGKPLDEVVGKTDFDFFPAEMAEDYLHHDRRVFATRQALETEEKFLERDELRDIRVIKTPTEDHRGDLNGLQIIVWDVTEGKRLERALRESEAFYEALVESLPHGIVRKDVQGTFTYVNHGACELLGMSRDEIIGKSDFDIFPTELAEKYRRDDRDVLHSGKRYEAVEINETVVGAMHHMQAVKTPVFDADGKPIGIQAVFWDVSERERLQSEVRQKSEQVDRLQEEVRMLKSS